jgi:hypothetical protein
VTAGLRPAATERGTILRALKVAAVVGTILTAINHGDVILQGGLPPVWKLLLTYFVPYAVSTYSAAASRLSPTRAGVRSNAVPDRSCHRVAGGG